MKKYYSVISVVVGLLTFYSCSLDEVPYDKYSEKIIWSTPEKANLYLNGFYTYFSKYGQFGLDQFDTQGVLTDGMTYALKYASTVPAYGTPNDYAYYPDMITSQQNSLDVWPGAYDRIRRIHEFMNGLNKYAEFDASIKTDFEAQIRFFRAYVYFQIMIRHNQFIILDKLTSEKNNPLGSTEDCWKFIETDLEFAAENLPVTRSSSDAGRLTKGAALAYLSRVALFAKHWAKAKTAAQDCINLKDGNGALVYGLNSSYEDSFRKSYFSGNKESIIEFQYASPNITHEMDLLFAPGGDAGNSAKVTLAGPTQEMVELYELKTGGYPDWSQWHSTTTETPPYDQLEPRFKASILYNDATWKGRKIQAYIDGIDGFHNYGDFQQSNGHTVTGYFLKKVLDENKTVIDGQSVTPYIEIRLAEVYLNLAEAANNLSDDVTANSAIKSVRSRVGLPWTDKTGTDLGNAIKHERKVELAFEGHIFWDLRRWGLAPTELNDVRFHGLRITKTGGTTFQYEYVSVDDHDRKFPELLGKTFPLPLSELNNNSAVEQLPGW
ncbi:MAG: RagB/SusD family nutrient uptake outer membrane protein [Bacteroidales bacterium]|nr:RagB/SusD family nutrient uptake outer membrane protein [Bacteroidales bacterium]